MDLKTGRFSPEECIVIGEFIELYWTPVMMKDFAGYLQEYLSSQFNTPEQEEEYRLFFHRTADALRRNNGEILDINVTVPISIYS